jgi:hypothetical protein
MVRRQLANLLFLGCLSCWVGGCALLGAAVDKTSGPATIPAKFVPPKEPTLVLVENYRLAAGGDVDCDRLGRYISQDLTENKVVPLVDFSTLTLLRDKDPDAYRKMSIAAIGKAVGAKQVIYVSVNDYGADTPMGSDNVKLRASAKVKVVDSQTGESRWPQDLADGEALSAETEYKDRGTDTNDVAVRDDLNKSLAEKIGKLFHEWQPDSDQPDWEENQ